MYTDYYKLRERPFELTSDPTRLFLTEGHREALSNLEYGISSGKSLTVLIGEPGTGKTTLLRAALGSNLCRHVKWVYLNNPALTKQEFVTILASSFELGEQAGRSKAALLEALERLLHERREQGALTALIVDEAQALSTELLEEIRLLGNIETSTEKLLPLVLAGQPELGWRLDHPSLRQIKQRVVLRCELLCFTLQETAGYIANRVWAAGGAPERLFTREAIRQIHRRSNGIPRTINVICDNALMTAMGLDRTGVDVEIVDEVCRDFALDGVTGGAAVARSTPPDPEPPAQQQGGSVRRTLGFGLFRSVRPSADNRDDDAVTQPASRRWGQRP